MAAHSSTRICLGVSSCLLGEKVRYDGNDKRDSYLLGTLARHFEFVPVCPEVAIGMGVPRPPIRLVGDPAAPRALGVRNPELDVTERLRAFAKQQAAVLGGLSGYIFKSKSPSCGIARVKVYQENGRMAERAAGIYAREIMAAHPLMPVEEEGRLGDPDLRDNFIERVFAYKRWQTLLSEGLTPARLVRFHTVHKLKLMAHGDTHYRALGRLIADAGARPADELAHEYGSLFMEALRQRATPRRQADVLQHLMGYLKKKLDAEDKRELLELIAAYRTGQAPLMAPLVLLRHHFRRHPHEYVEQQLYLYPPPEEMLLRGC